MKKWICAFVVLYFFIVPCSHAQEKYFTKTGRISFFSGAPLENIEAVNKTAGAVLDTKTGNLQAVLLMRGFEFKKALMQEHFNDNYVESHNYPKAELKAAIDNPAGINFTSDGTYRTTVKGQLNFHGVTREVTIPVTLKTEGGRIQVNSVFDILLSDYRISIPGIVKDKINNNVKVTADFSLEPLKR